LLDIVLDLQIYINYCIDNKLNCLVYLTLYYLEL
jgi:hypothetical protein